MQVLADQYTKLYTYKRRIYYSDFVVDSTTRQSCLILPVARAVELVTAKCFLRETFTAPSLSSCNLYIIMGNDLALSNEAVKTPMVTNLRESVTDYSGKIGSLSHGLANQSAPTDIYARIITNSISGGAAFTAGYFDLWLTTSKYP